MPPHSVLPNLLRWQSHADEPLNSYLWNGPQGLIAIDPTADIPTEWAKATRILATHIQREHLAGATNWPHIPLFVPKKDAYLCAGQVAYENLITPWEEPWDWEERGNFQGHVARARNERPPLEPVEVAGILHDGYTIGGLHVVATSGHGKDALTFWTNIEGQKVAFCGDLICGDGQLWNWFDAEWDYGLQIGQKTLRTSAQRLLELEIDVLLPTHGEPIFEARQALETLIERLNRVLEDPPFDPNPINFSDNDRPTTGWRELSPHLFQWKAGNCALLVSRDGVGLLVDDGLCHWAPLAERAAHHRAVMAEIKRKLGLSRIEAVLVTHYHGDHIYNIPHLIEEEKSQVWTLDIVAGVMEHSEAFNLAAKLPWYGAEHDTVNVDRVFRADETVRWHEYEIEWFHLGGQTYYHAGMTMQIDGARVVFAGDATYGWNPGCDVPVCYNDIEPSRRGGAYSIERLIEKAPDLLVLGHGSALRDPMPLLQQKRAAWQQQLAEFDALNAQSSREAFFNPFLFSETSLIRG